MDVTPRLDVAARRIAAWLVDWALILAWAAVLLAHAAPALRRARHHTGSGTVSSKHSGHDLGGQERNHIKSIEVFGDLRSLAGTRNDG